jgi:hypothetical protein
MAKQFQRRRFFRNRPDDDDDDEEDDDDDDDDVETALRNDEKLGKRHIWKVLYKDC